MDQDISFGDVEERAPERQLRPDQNRHYAVTEYAHPDPNDLPIYIDMDVMREIETHGEANTRVELGGVLLGGQYEDESGRPFVVITCSLRAEHYEATKGSFKFTHETWHDITRKRHEFPVGTRMVGWYHTHPGWGVFLSGMDTFMCENFFNNPLDVALVVDPCRRDRAFFQWERKTSAPRQTRATRGFYLFGSRFRKPELDAYAAQLQGQFVMSSDPRHATSSSPPPVVNLASSTPPWLSLAVLGILLLQFSLLALIAWRVLLNEGSSESTARLDRETELRQAERLKAQRELLDEVIGTLEVAPEGVVTALEDQRRRNAELASVRRGLSVLVRQLEKEHADAEREQERLRADQKELVATLEQLREENESGAARIAQLEKQIDGGTSEASDVGVRDRVWGWIVAWKWYLSGAALVVLAAVLAVLAMYETRRRRRGAGGQRERDERAERED